MKGNPIITAVIALAIMLGFYLTMQAILDAPTLARRSTTTSQTASSEQTTAHTYVLEAYFSSAPSLVKLIDPLTKAVVFEMQDPQETELIADFALKQKRNPLELRVVAEFPPAKTRHFITLTLSSDDLAPQTHTLHNTGNIDDILTYDWR